MVKAKSVTYIKHMFGGLQLIFKKKKKKNSILFYSYIACFNHFRAGEQHNFLFGKALNMALYLYVRKISFVV